MNDPDRGIWESVLSHLRVSHRSLCRAWFAELEPVGMIDGTLRVRASSKLHRDYLHRECLEAFNDALRTVSGRLISMKFLGPEEPLNPNGHANGVNGAHGGANGSAHGVNGAPKQVNGASNGLRAGRNGSLNAGHLNYTDGLVVNPDFGFDQFVIGPGNRLAHAAAQGVASKPGKEYNPLFIHGGVGLGKTHLLQAICLRIVENNPDAVIYYTSCEGFKTQFFEAVQQGEMGRFRDKYRGVDLLVLDDIHFLANQDRTQEEFFHTFNSLFQAGKQIVLSSDAPPDEIPDLEDRLVSRFKSGLVARVDPPCFETRVAILKKKAELHSINLTDDVASFIATRIDRNIRELEGALRNIIFRAQVDQKPIDLELATEELGEISPATNGGLTIQSIIDVVTGYYNVRMPDLQSKKRNRSIALPRQVCMFEARKHTRHSLEEIGGYFGGRDHTTVMHAVRAIEAKREVDAQLDHQLVEIETRLGVAF
jgi:chromosomal replication initiator protein